MENPLVSVVVPAFNAEATIAETLHSAASQTLKQLEIVVVDDGSTDGTAAIVNAFATRDPRVRLLRQANAGVAAARNAGLAAARGQLVAPLDADDLWHPTKIEKQLAASRRAPVRPALTYCLYRPIDRAGRAGREPRVHLAAGPALCQLLFFNFVGNGSAPLMDRAAVMALGGYDRRLRLLGAEGCEDVLLQWRLAAHHPIAVVPEFLVGYRQLPGNMSSNVERMFRSRMIALGILREECPDIPPFVFRWSVGARRLAAAQRAWRAGARLRAGAHFARACVCDPVGAAAALARSSAFAGSRAVAAYDLLPEEGSRRPGFTDLPPEMPLRPQPYDLTTRRLARLADIDHRRDRRGRAAGIPVPQRGSPPRLA